MKASVLQENLRDGLKVVGRAAAGNRSLMPELSCIRIDARAGSLLLSATDLSLRIDCRIGARVDEEGVASVPARVFSDLVAVLAPDRVDLELDERTLSLGASCHQTRANIKGLSGDAIVPLEDLEVAEDGKIALDAEDLRVAIEQVAFAAAKEQDRPILTGVMVEIEGGKATMAAADGYRLGVRTFDAAGSLGPVIVPVRFLDELVRAIKAKEVEDVVLVTDNEKHRIQCEIGSVTITGQLLAGNFPDYTAIIPKEFTTRSEVNASAFRDACETAGIFAAHNNHIITVEMTDDQVRVTANSETGDGESVVDAQVEGTAGSISFNARWLVEAVKAAGTPTVVLKITNKHRPMKILTPGEPGFTHVLMPMHKGN